MKGNGSVARLTGDQAAAYWDERHQKTDPWRAGGDRGLSEQANEIFYYVRYGLLLRMLVRHFGNDRCLWILDAGCGRGWLTAHLHSLGHNVVGVDQSEAAIRYARRTCDATFAVAPLDEFVSDQRFDAVVCMDVLYHITDDEQWQSSIRNLRRRLRDEGVLIFSGILESETRELGDYVVHRSRADYERVLAGLSLTISASEPYGVFSPAAWHLCVGQHSSGHSASRSLSATPARDLSRRDPKTGCGR